MAARRLAPRDRQEAGQRGLGGEQVVAGAVEPPLDQVAADRVEVPVGLVERAEVHRRRVPFGPHGELAGLGEQLGRRRVAYRHGDRLEPLGRRGRNPRHQGRELLLDRPAAFDHGRQADLRDQHVAERPPAPGAALVRPGEEPGPGRATADVQLADRLEPGGERGELGAMLLDLGREAARPRLELLGPLALGAEQGPDAADQAERRAVELRQPFVTAEQVGGGRAEQLP